MRSKQQTYRELEALHESVARSADLTKRRYTVPELMRVTDISLQKVRYWKEIGLLVPSWVASDARGCRPAYYYSAQNVVKAVMIIEMCKRGLSLREVHTIDKNLKKDGLRLEESAKYLLTNGETACYASSPTEVVDILKHRGQMLLVLMDEPVKALHKQLRSRMVA
jgi:DNA-binding transcriptional MerR regulator